MKKESSLRSSVRRVLALALPARRPRRRSCLLVAALAAWGWGSGAAGAAEPLFRQRSRSDFRASTSANAAIRIRGPRRRRRPRPGRRQLPGRVHYFENVGSLAVPSFRERPGSANPFRLFTVPSIASPDLPDLDGDGDRDLILGGDEGTLRYFENTGSATAPAFLERTRFEQSLFGIDVGDFSSPDLADLDGDGDLDAVVGNAVGEFSYFANTGSASAPAFMTAGIPSPASSSAITVRPSWPTSTATAISIWSPGLSWAGSPYFRNTGSASAAAFVEQTGSANPFALVAGRAGSYLRQPGAGRSRRQRPARPGGRRRRRLVPLFPQHRQRVGARLRRRRAERVALRRGRSRQIRRRWRSPISTRTATSTPSPAHDGACAISAAPAGAHAGLHRADRVASPLAGHRAHRGLPEPGFPISTTTATSTQVVANYDGDLRPTWRGNSGSASAPGLRGGAQPSANPFAGVGRRSSFGSQHTRRSATSIATATTDLLGRQCAWWPISKIPACPSAPGLREEDRRRESLPERWLAF